MSIEARNLSFHYGSRKALQNLSFKLETGKFNALLGPNGAGKSTLFALLTRLYSLQQGEIFINRQSIRQHPGDVMRSLGVVFQQSTLDLDLTVAQNLNYHAALHGINTSTTRQMITEQLDRLDMLDRLNDKVRNLNGGHRRRVEIARALLHRPSILLLDEATVGLDPQARTALNQHVRQLCRSQQLTVLWATHLIEEIHPDDPVIILHQGDIKAHASGTEICQQHLCEQLTDAFNQLTGKPQ